MFVYMCITIYNIYCTVIYSTIADRDSCIILYHFSLSPSTDDSTFPSIIEFDPPCPTRNLSMMYFSIEN